MKVMIEMCGYVSLWWRNEFVTNTTIVKMKFLIEPHVCLLYFLLGFFFMNSLGAASGS